MNLKRLLLASAIFFGGSAVVLAIAYASRPVDSFALCRENNMVDFTAIGGDFELIDETGQTVTNDDVFDRPTILYIGYSFCPDVCPMDNMRNADVVYLLEERGVDARAVFVSVDPGRDTPEVLAHFTDAFHPRMIGLTGTPENLRTFAEQYASSFEIQNQDDEFYLIDHTTLTFTVLPEHGVVDVVRRDEAPEDVAERTSCLINSA